MSGRLRARPDRVTLAVTAIALLALAARLWRLGERAMHHDESLHAAFAWYYAAGEGYAHDPLMHGPLQFHLIAGTFRLLGDGEVTARLPAALAGAALVLVPLWWRRWLGPAGTVAAAVFLATSPSLLYYARFARNDALAALWTALLFTAAWRYATGGGRRWLLLLAAALGLGLATKETVYLSVAVLLLGLHAALARSDVGWRDGGARRRVTIAATAWVRALWAVLRSPPRDAAGEGPGSAAAAGGVTPQMRRLSDLLIVTGTLIAPTLAALVQLPLSVVGVEPTGAGERLLAVGTAALLAAAAAAAGLRWRPTLWVGAAVVAYGIAVPLYASLGTHPAGVGGLFWDSLDYWLDQQGVARGGQPPWYYAMLLPLYEPLLLLLPAAAWLVWWRVPRSRRGGARAAGGQGAAAAGALAWWAVGTGAALTVAGEKMPWLLVHIVVPLALLAGWAVPLLGTWAWQVWWAARASLERRGVAAAARGAALGGGAALMLLLGAYTVASGTAVTYGHPDVAREPLIYTQSGPQLPVLARRIEAYTAARGGAAHPIVVDGRFAISWPWAWYLRHHTAVTYTEPDALDLDQVDRRAVVIASTATVERFPAAAARYAERVQYDHRAWFPEEGYRHPRRTLLDRAGPGRLAAFLLHRISAAEVGALPAVVLLPDGPAAGDATGRTP